MWFSRAVLDVVGTGGGVRVAYLASLPELAGLIVLSGLLLTLAQTLAERARTRWRPAAPVDSSLLLPLGLLTLLAVPYLPLLPDALPALRALAGPLASWVWTVTLALVAWAIAASMFQPTTAPRRRRAGANIAILAVTAAISASAAFLVTPGPLFPGGDEPHYLVVTQSLLRDGDLRIEDNHARGDYREYFNAPLKPDHIVAPAQNGAIYSIHPIGTSVLVAPGFLLSGYRGASLTIVVVASLAGLLLWRWLRATTGSAGAATFGWLAIVTSAPFVLHSFVIYPEIPAACVLVAALGLGVTREPSTRSALAAGLLTGLLPWLGTKYAPMSAVVLGLLLMRTRDRRLQLAAIAPYVVLVLAWLGWFQALWGTPSPTAPYGTATQMAWWHLGAGLPGLLFDQEYGVFAVAPLSAVAGIGWWHLWRRGDADGRRLVAETALPFATLAFTVAAYEMWWGGSAPPGRQLTAALPLLGLPVAALWRDLSEQPVRRGILIALLAVGVTTTAVFLLVHDGLLIANARDGRAAMLEYLAPSRDLVRAAPSFIAHRDAPWRPLAIVFTWILFGAAAWSAAGRAHTRHHGRAGLIAAACTFVPALAASAVVPLWFGSFSAPPVPAQLRVSAPALDAYDAMARPIAIVYDPFRPALPEQVAELVQFSATPGARRSSQPVRVLLNARLSLPAGTYRLTIEPRPAQRLTGTLGLQVGRIGIPRETWQVDAAPGAAWETSFALDMDAGFVGLRATREFEQATGKLQVRPVTIVDANRRLTRPPVLAAAEYYEVPVYFHDDHAYVEPNGFWARGRTTHDLTIGLRQGAQPPGVRLQLHSGDGITRVHLATPAWSDVVSLTSGTPQSILVPALASQRLLPLTITPESGFVPSQRHAGVNDDRLLGCWVEVLP